MGIYLSGQVFGDAQFKHTAKITDSDVCTNYHVFPVTCHPCHHASTKPPCYHHCDHINCKPITSKNFRHSPFLLLYSVLCIIEIQNAESVLERAVKREKGHYVPAPDKIQRQWCYRAPIKALPLHYSLFFCSSQCISQHTAFQSDFLRELQLMPFNPKWENPFTSPS